MIVQVQLALTGNSYILCVCVVYLFFQRCKMCIFPQKREKNGSNSVQVDWEKEKKVLESFKFDCGSGHGTKCKEVIFVMLNHSQIYSLQGGFTLVNPSWKIGQPINVLPHRLGSKDYLPYLFNWSLIERSNFNKDFNFFNVNINFRYIMTGLQFSGLQFSDII